MWLYIIIIFVMEGKIIKILTEQGRNLLLVVSSISKVKHQNPHRTRKKPLVGGRKSHLSVYVPNKEETSCWLSSKSSKDMLNKNCASCWLSHHLKISSQNLMPNKEEPLVGLGPEQGIEPLVGRSINSMLSAHASMVEVWREVDRAPLLLQHWLNCISTVVSVLPFPWLMSNHPYVYHHYAQWLKYRVNYHQICYCPCEFSIQYSSQ